MAQMEDEMGVKLFDSGKRKIVLTNEGMLLRRRAGYAGSDPRFP